MRSPVLLGAGLALAVGVLALAGIVAAVNARPPLAPPPTTPPAGGSPLGLYTPSPSPSPTPVTSVVATLPVGTQVGLRAPRLTLPALDGGAVDTAEFAGTPLWINFMATWCPSCRDEVPMMRRISNQLLAAAEENAAEGEAVATPLQVVFVDVGEDEATVREFMADFVIDLPVGLDEEGVAQHQWGAFALPVHFFVDADGVVREVVFGGAPEEIFIAAIGTVVPDAALEPEESPEGDPGVEP